MELYQSQFEELANRTEGLNVSFMISCFVGGLKEEIRLSVQMLKPTTLTDAIGLACMQEENVEALRHQNHQESIITLLIKKLTPVKIKEMREKGLCYNCDIKFSPGHRCKV